MVRLLGVAHGGYEYSLFNSREFSIDPARELIEDLAKLPKGSRVGVEWLEVGDWYAVQEDLVRRSSDAALLNTPFFDHSTAQYWEILDSELEQLGLDPVFLEDKDIWFKHNQAFIEMVLGNQEDLFYEGESDKDYNLKLCKHNEARKSRILASRRIHEIERDEALLSAVASGNLDAAVVGIEHSDYWYANRARIQEQLGLTFDSYAKQQPTGKGLPLTVFVRNAEPDNQILWDRKSLERAIRLSEHGRVLESGTPDYVGTWCDYEPSKGYFEVFVQEREGEEISGVIEDILGRATFRGKINGSGIQFTKIYTNAAAEAIRGELLYQAQRFGDEFWGYCQSQGAKIPFYLIKADKKDSIELGVRMYELSHPVGSIVKALNIQTLISCFYY